MSNQQYRNPHAYAPGTQEAFDAYYAAMNASFSVHFPSGAVSKDEEFGTKLSSIFTTVIYQLCKDFPIEELELNGSETVFRAFEDACALASKLLEKEDL